MLQTLSPWISGYPLTERRLLAGFPTRAQSMATPILCVDYGIIGKQMTVNMIPSCCPFGRSFLQRWAGTT